MAKKVAVNDCGGCSRMNDFAFTEIQGAMPTLLIQDGFKFFFYANEHLPMHIHVAKGGGYAKIDLVTLEVSPNYLKSAETKIALEIVEANRTKFVRRWNDFFAQR